MKYFAIIDSNNEVANVFVAPDDTTEEFYTNSTGKKCLESFPDRSQRVRPAGKGGSYSKEYDAFINPQPFASWNLNTETLDWESPEVKPEDDANYFYTWDEENLTWKKNPFPYLTSFTKEDNDLLEQCSSPEEVEAIKDQLSEAARNVIWPA